MNWVNVHSQAVPFGFAYFDLYVNPANAQVLGWVARQNGSNEYLFYYFEGQTGGGLQQGSRGTVRHAMDAVDGAVARAKTTIGISQSWIPQITQQIIVHTALQQKRGW